MHLRRLVKPFLAAALLAGVPALAARPAHAATLAGQWRIERSASCSGAPGGSALCSSIVGPGASRADWFTITADGDGNFTFVGGYRLIGSATGAPSTCDATAFSQPFNGTCEIDVFGSGVIKPGATGLPDFWITAETTTAYNGQPASVPSPRGATAYPIDTGVPAVSGVYATQQNLAILGLLTPGTTAPAGVYLQLSVLQRLPGNQPEAPLPDPYGGTPVGPLYVAPCQHA